MRKMLKHKIQIGEKVLPIPLKGSADLVYRDHKNRLIIRDHKFTSRYSDPEAIDGGKTHSGGVQLLSRCGRDRRNALLNGIRRVQDYAERRQVAPNERV